MFTCPRRPAWPWPLQAWQGRSDQHITPQSTLEYYEAMRDVMGAEAVESFAKPHLFPGVAHCPGGLGPDMFDVLTPVMAWVETGTSPGEVVASKVEGAAVTRTRPVFPHPAGARYAGSGSTDDAANLVTFTPRTEPRVGYRRVGAPLYSSGYQATRRADGTQLVCQPSGLNLGGGQP